MVLYCKSSDLNLGAQSLLESKVLQVVEGEGETAPWRVGIAKKQLGFFLFPRGGEVGMGRLRRARAA